MALSELSWGGVALRLQGNGVRWRDPHLRLLISRTVHTPAGDLGVDRRDTVAGVHATIVDAIQQWVRAGEGAVSIDVELTDEQLISPHRNLVTFTDPTPFENGTCNKDVMVACAVLNFDPVTGEMLTASIVFNPYKRHSALGLSHTNDIGLVMLHEVGHILGLDHTPLPDAAMSATAEMEAPGGGGAHYARRLLSADDALTLRSIYGGATGLSRLRGAVRQRGQAVSNAHVMAMDAGGSAVWSALTNESGHYDVLVPPGEYRLIAEPPDSPAGVAGPSFPTVFWTAAGGDAREGELLATTEGETREGIDFDLPDAPVLNLTHIGLRANGRYLGYPRTVVARGRSYDLGMGRSPAGIPGSVRIVGGGIETVGEPVLPASGPGFIFQKIHVTAGARLGAYTAQFLTQEAGAVMAGAVRVAPNPQIEKVLPAEGEAGQPFAPGQRIVLSGTDLAAAAAEGERWTEDAPLPTQLAGTSVLVGDVYAQLLSVHPERIELLVPAIGGGGNASIRVLTGIGVESNLLEVSLTVQ